MRVKMIGYQVSLDWTEGDARSEAADAKGIFEAVQKAIPALFAQLKDEQARSDALLLASYAANGYARIGWMAKARFRAKSPDAPFELPPFILELPVLFEKDDAYAFDRQVRIASAKMSLAIKRDPQATSFPDMRFRAYFMSDADHRIIRNYH